MKFIHSSYLFALLILAGTVAPVISKNLSGRIQVPTEEITFDVGRGFTLTAKMAGGTGYTKEFTIQKSSKKLIEMTDSGYENAKSMMPGAPVTLFATFVTLEKGTATIVLESQAPGKNQRKKMEKIYKVTIK